MVRLKAALLLPCCLALAAGSEQAQISEQVQSSEQVLGSEQAQSSERARSSDRSDLVVQHDGLSESGPREQHVRVCNAYADDHGVDIYRGGGGEERLTRERPLAYKECQDFVATLGEGDSFSFKAGSATIGTFQVTGLPTDAALLLLVVQRIGGQTHMASFQSHTFASLSNAQVAVMDAYSGPGEAAPRIMDRDDKRSDSLRAESLQYDRVVVVTPGVYDVALVGREGDQVARTSLDAKGRESYVILRTGLEGPRGLEGPQGRGYDQDLVVYPQRGGAARGAGVLAFAAALVLSLC